MIALDVIRHPRDLAEALLRGPLTPARIRKFLRLTKGRPPAFVAQALAALPEDVRALVEQP